MIQRLKGTRDFSPEEMSKRRRLESILREISLRYGFREIQTPVIESSELFVLKSGPGILEEMYVFKDKGGREIALRPELTAPIIRFFVNELSNYPLPLKVFCISPVFRYEEPQSGRYREFVQYDVETIGAETPEADAELLILASDICSKAGLKNIRIRIGHVGIIREKLDEAGVPAERQSEFLHLMDRKKQDEASKFLTDLGIAKDVADSIVGVCQISGGAGVLDSLKGERADYMKKVISILKSSGNRFFQVDMGVVRGLDYYTGVVFEIDAPDLGAEKQICGGGSYSLSRLFGGTYVPSTGFAFGFDRLLIAMEKAGWKAEKEHIDAFVLAVSAGESGKMMEIAAMLRDNGIITEADLMGRNISKGLKYAAARNASFAVIVGSKEMAAGKVTLRNMKSGKQVETETSLLPELIKKGGK